MIPASIKSALVDPSSTISAVQLRALATIFMQAADKIDSQTEVAESAPITPIGAQSQDKEDDINIDF